METVWKKYKETEDIDLRNQLIENYVYLVKIVAGRMYNFYGSRVEYDDLVGYGILGLIDSIDKFDISKDIKFSTYAQIRIRGEMIDNIRKLDWVPRTLRSKSKEVQEAISKLENKFGRRPTNEEIAELLEISLKNLEEILADMSSFNIYSLEETIFDNGEIGIDNSKIETPEMILEEEGLKQTLVAAIDSLSENEKMVISLYYYDELTYKEIGKILDLSESRISQIHSKSILTMKNYMEKIDN